MYVLAYVLLIFGIIFILLSIYILFSQLISLTFDMKVRKTGPFYAPTLHKNVRKMLELIGSVKGKKVVDLGSGDGRLVIFFAKNGAEVTGYEINPVLVFESKINVFLARQTKNAKIINDDFWQADLSDTDIVVLYGISWIMEKLEKKLLKELKPGAKVISNSFTFPNWKSKKSIDKMYLYVK